MRDLDGLCTGSRHSCDGVGEDRADARALKPPLIPLDETLVDVGEHLTPAIPLDAIPSDPDDNRILECAVADRAHLIVPGDRDLRHFSTYDGIGIAVPRDSMRLLCIPDRP